MRSCVEAHATRRGVRGVREIGLSRDGESVRARDARRSGAATHGLDVDLAVWVRLGLAVDGDILHEFAAVCFVLHLGDLYVESMQT